MTNIIPFPSEPRLEVEIVPAFTASREKIWIVDVIDRRDGLTITTGIFPSISAAAEAARQWDAPIGWGEL